MRAAFIGAGTSAFMITEVIMFENISKELAVYAKRRGRTITVGRSSAQVLDAP